MRKTFSLPKPPTGWRHEGWRSCQDLQTEDVSGVPRWFRCQRCNHLVTHRMVQMGGCMKCGTRRIHGARILSWAEILFLKLGWFPLDARERTEVRPLFGR